jgi:hypothetical protein
MCLNSIKYGVKRLITLCYFYLTYSMIKVLFLLQLEELVCFPFFIGSIAI